MEAEYPVPMMVEDLAPTMETFQVVVVEEDAVPITKLTMVS